MDKTLGHAAAAAIIGAAQKTNRTLLTEVESKQILDAYGIPTVPARIARGEDEAVRVAAEIGPTVVLKLHSEIITHKTDVGGVKLNLRTEDEIRQAYQGGPSRTGGKVPISGLYGPSERRRKTAKWPRP